MGLTCSRAQKFARPEILRGINQSSNCVSAQYYCVNHGDHRHVLTEAPELVERNMPRTSRVLCGNRLRRRPLTGPSYIIVIMRRSQLRPCCASFIDVFNGLDINCCVGAQEPRNSPLCDRTVVENGPGAVLGKTDPGEPPFARIGGPGDRSCAPNRHTPNSQKGSLCALLF